MDETLLDMSFLHDMSEGDPVYIYELVTLYIDTVPAGMAQLEQLIKTDAPWDAIRRQAHFLKSSASVVKVRNVHENLITMEALARQEKGRDKIATLLHNILESFNEALPLIKDERKAAAARIPAKSAL